MKGINTEWFERLSEHAIPNYRGLPYEVSYVELWTDCPGEHETMWIYYRLEKGVGCVEHRCGYDASDIPPSNLMVRGTYDGFVKIIRGKSDPVRALLSGKFQPVNCSVKMLIKHMSLFNLLTESKRSIDWDY